MKFENMIDELWQEVKEEINYNKRYEKELQHALDQEKMCSKPNVHYWNFIDRERFPRESRKSIIRANLKMIRRLSIKYEKELKEG